ncbi:V-type ATP synthase subunit F [Nocardioides dilutus]
MPRVAVIGEQPRVQGFALAGAEVRPSTDPDEVRAAWAGLADDVAVVVLTPAAAAALAMTAPGHRLTVVMPP